MQYWYDTFQRLDSDPLITDVYSRRLQGRVAPSGQTWVRHGGELSAPYYDRVGVYADDEARGLYSAPRFTYEGALYTPSSFATPNGATSYTHPDGFSIYYLNSVATARHMRVATNFFWSGKWYSATDTGVEAIPTVIANFIPGSNSYYYAQMNTLTATLTVGKVVGGTVVATQDLSVRPITYAAAGTESIDFAEAWVELSLYVTQDTVDTSKDNVRAVLAAGYGGSPDYSEGTLFVGLQTTALPLGYPGLKLDTFTSYGGSSVKWFSAVCEPLGFAAGAFDQPYYDPELGGIVCRGFQTIEGGLAPYNSLWYVNGEFTASEEDGSVFVPNPTYDQVWNGSEFVPSAKTYTFVQLLRDVRSTNAFSASNFDVVDDTIIPLEILVGEGSIVINPPGSIGPDGSVTPFQRKSCSARAKIVGAALGSNGIQSFSLSNTGTTAGRSHIFQHPDGLLYMVYAESVSPTSEERCLYMQTSPDNGTTWNDPVCLTTGFWDDGPCAIAIEDSTVSNIGIVFNRSTRYWGEGSFGVNIGGIPYLTRMVVDQEGTLIGGIDRVAEGGPYSTPSLVRKDDGFLIAAAHYNEHPDSAIHIHLYENVDFSANSWTYRQISSDTLLANIPGWVPFQRPLVRHVALRRLRNGDIAMLFAVTGDMNNKEPSGNPARSNFRRYDLWVAISTNQGDSFGSFQNLTPQYTSAPTGALTADYEVTTADLAQLSDDSLAVVYSEGSVLKRLTNTTSPAFSPAANTLCMHYLASKSILLLGTDGDGLYALNLVTGSTKKFATDTVPFFWGNYIRCLIVNDDETRLAVGTTTSLEILDISDLLATNWTLDHSLRGTTLPALRTPYISAGCWTDSTTLYTFYGGNGSGVANVVGAKFDLTLGQLDTGFMTDVLVTTGATRLADYANVRKWNGYLIFKSTNQYITALPYTSGYTGSGIYYSGIIAGAYNGKLFYDPYAQEFLAVLANSTQLVRMKPTITGTTLTWANNGLHTMASVSYNGLTEPLEVPNAGILGRTVAQGLSSHWTMWNYADQQHVGVLQKADEGYEGTSLWLTYPATTHFTADGSWMISHWGYPFGTGIYLRDLQRTGLLRYSIFAYDSDTHTLTVPSSPVWTPVSNPLKIGTDVNHFLEPRLAVDTEDRLYVTGYYQRLTAQQTPVARIFAEIEPDAYKLQARARIIAVSSQSLTARLRMMRNDTATLDSKALINFAQCVKIRAHILPFQTQTVTVRGRIAGRKRSAASATFYVQANRRTFLRSTFYAGDGRVTSSTMTSRASITRSGRAITGMSFAVTANAIPSGIITVALQQRGVQRMTVRAWITRDG